MSFYILGDMDYLREEDVLTFKLSYKHKYIDAINVVVSCLKSMSDWAKGIKPRYKEEVSSAKYAMECALFDINTWGDVATEFLVRVLRYNIKGYSGSQKIIVTSSFFPERDFADLIAQGFKVVRLTQLVYCKSNCPEFYIERENVFNVLEPTYYPPLFSINVQSSYGGKDGGIQLTHKE